MFAKQLGRGLVCVGLLMAGGTPSWAKDADSKAAAGSDAGVPAGAHAKGAIGVSLSSKDGKLSVSAVHPGSPALKAGIKIGDQIDTVGGTAVTTPQQFIAEITKRAPGSKVDLGISRGGEKQTISATLSSVEKLRSASQNRQIRDLQQQLLQLQAQVNKINNSRNAVPPAFQGNGNNSWYYEEEEGDDNQGLHDWGARARDGQ